MVIVLSGMAAVVIAVQKFWTRLTRGEQQLSSQTSGRVKLSLNLLIVAAQAVTYVVELLSGARTSPPSSKTVETSSSGGGFARTAATTPGYAG